MKGKAQRRKRNTGWSSEAHKRKHTLARVTLATPSDTEAFLSFPQKFSASPMLGWSVPNIEC